MIRILFTIISVCLLTLNYTPLIAQTKQVKQPKEDETLIYSNPSKPIKLKPGDKHPTQTGWYFFTAHEFKDKDVNPNGVPYGFEDQMKWFKNHAAIDNSKCMRVKKRCSPSSYYRRARLSCQFLRKYCEILYLLHTNGCPHISTILGRFYRKYAL